MVEPRQAKDSSPVGHTNILKVKTRKNLNDNYITASAQFGFLYIPNIVNDIHSLELIKSRIIQIAIKIISHPYIYNKVLKITQTKTIEVVIKYMKR